MRLLKSAQQIPYEVGVELLGSHTGMLMLVCLVVMSISIISMLAFACVGDGKPKEKPSDLKPSEQWAGGFYAQRRRINTINGTHIQDHTHSRGVFYVGGLAVAGLGSGLGGGGGC